MTLTFDLLTLKVVSKSCVMWGTSAPILVFLAPSVLDLGPMYATDRRQTKASPNMPIRGGASYDSERIYSILRTDVNSAGAATRRAVALTYKSAIRWKRP